MSLTWVGSTIFWTLLPTTTTLGQWRRVTSRSKRDSGHRHKKIGTSTCQTGRYLSFLLFFLKFHEAFLAIAKTWLPTPESGGNPLLPRIPYPSGLSPTVPSAPTSWPTLMTPHLRPARERRPTKLQSHHRHRCGHTEATSQPRRPSSRTSIWHPSLPNRRAAAPVRLPLHLP